MQSHTLRKRNFGQWYIDLQSTIFAVSHPDSPVSAIAGGAGGGVLLLVLTALILLCILIMRKVHFTTDSSQSKLHTSCCFKHGFNSNLCFLVSLSIKFSPKPDNQHSLNREKVICYQLEFGK